MAVAPPAVGVAAPEAPRPLSVELPFDELKVDRQFVHGACRDAALRAVLLPCLQMARQLGIATVAEGVETAQQLAALTKMGVDEFQGYHFARPMPVDEWLDVLRGATEGGPQLPLQGAVLS